MLSLYISFHSRHIFIAGEKEVINYVFFPNGTLAFHVQKIWPWNHYADETASKWARFAYQGIVRCACSLKKKKKKRLTNCFKFILYLSPSSPPSLTPWDAGSWRCFSGWDAVSSPSDWSGSTVTVFLYRPGGRGGGILTQRLYSGGMWRSLGLEFM